MDRAHAYASCSWCIACAPLSHMRGWRFWGAGRRGRTQVPVAAPSSEFVAAQCEIREWSEMLRIYGYSAPTVPLPTMLLERRDAAARHRASDGRRRRAAPDAGVARCGDATVARLPRIMPRTATRTFASVYSATARGNLFPIYIRFRYVSNNAARATRHGARCTFIDTRHKTKRERPSSHVRSRTRQTKCIGRGGKPSPARVGTRRGHATNETTRGLDRIYTRSNNLFVADNPLPAQRALHTPTRLPSRGRAVCSRLFG